MRLCLVFILFFLVFATIASLTGCRERNVEVTEQPVEVLSESVGIGKPAEPGDFVTVNYVAYLPDGKPVQQRDGYQFTLGSGHTILAFDEAVVGMREGGSRRIDCPPHKHWGRAGYGEGEGAIPEATRLTFEIKLVSID